jgi:hypothetical protein
MGLCLKGAFVLHQLNELLKKMILEDRAAGAPRSSSVDVSFETPTREWSQLVSRPTVNLFLYDLRENHARREMTWARSVDDSGRQASMRRRPIRVDASYLVTCWTRVAEDAHDLLWGVLETFIGNPTIPSSAFKPELVNDVLVEAAQPEAQSRSMAEFWGSLGNDMHPGIHVIATIEVDLHQEITSGITFERRLRVTDVVPRDPLAEHSEQIAFGGVVRQAGRPLPRTRVRLLRENSGHTEQVATTHTDDEGRYRFSGLEARHYTLELERDNKTKRATVNLDEGQSPFVFDFDGR